jgi:3-phosphoshikimate 1-carboxyvinyltransferase
MVTRDSRPHPSTRTFAAPPRLRGALRVPGDKSISHRAVLLAALGRGTSRIVGLSDGDDVQASVAAIHALGVRTLRDPSTGALIVRGVPDRAWRAQPSVIDCGNSGTTMRLLAGLLAGGPTAMTCTLTGDASLSRRPMARIAEPLSALGARVEARGPDAPLVIATQPRLPGGHVRSAIASAQVKSAALLAGLIADAPVAISQPAASRDHTERLLRAMGAQLDVQADVQADAQADAQADVRADDNDGATGWLTHTVTPGPLDALDWIRVPGDLSGAAFVIVAALLHPDARVLIDGVGMNETRSGLLDAAQVPRLIDELPVLALAAACAEGTSRFAGVLELQHKESDRLAGIRTLLGSLGVGCQLEGDTLVIEGDPGLREREPPHLVVDAGLDHRMAMTAAVAGIAGLARAEVHGFETTRTSWPDFAAAMDRLAEGRGGG